MPNWPSKSFVTDKNTTDKANRTTAYHNYIIVFAFLHRMLEAAASAKSWYSTYLPG
jgi:esterase/lipase superfamily enzyme